MFTGIQIESKVPVAKQETCFDGLLGCHERIRHFTSVSRKIADAVGQPEQDIAAAAESVHRYFTVALPLHEADENQSVDPRVQALIPEQELVAASATMVAQHKEINQTLRKLIPAWESLRQHPARLAEVAAELRENSDRLAQLFDAHLRLEEEIVFAAMRRYFPPEELAAIKAEMQRRRA